MDIKFEITPECEAREIHWKDEKTGRSGVMYKQNAYVTLPTEPYPQKAELSLKSLAAAYPPGHYLLDGSSFYLNKYKNLSLSARLTPLD